MDQPNPDPGGTSSKIPSPQELSELKDQNEQQMVLIAQLKEMLRKEQSTVSQDKVEEYMNSLTRARAKRSKQKSTSSTTSSTSVNIDANKRERVNLLRQQLEENKARLAERGKSQKGIEEMVTQLQAQLKDSQTSTDINKTYNENTSQKELYNILLTKEKKIAELLNKSQKLETTVIDLQENVKEKDSVIDARTKAITLMTESLSKKGKNTLDNLEETKEQMRKMQEHFVNLESEMKARQLTLLNDLKMKNFEINELQEKLTNKSEVEAQLEDALTELKLLKNTGMALNQPSDQQENEISKLKKQLDESNKSMIKMRAVQKGKIKELNKKLDQFRKTSDSNALIAQLQTEICQLNEKIAELEDEKGNYQLKMVDKDENKIIENLQVEICNLKKELQQKNEEQVSKEVSSIYFEEQIEKLESEKKKLNEELNEANKEKENILQELTNLKKEKQDLNTKLDLYIQENIELIDKLEKLSAEKVSSAESIEIVEGLTQQEKLELAAYQKHINPEEKYLEKDDESIEPPPELNESVLQLSEDTAELLQKIEMFTQERKEVMVKMEMLKEENNLLNQKVKEIENNRDILEETYEQLQNEKDILVNEKRELFEKLQQNTLQEEKSANILDANLKNLQIKYEALIKENDSLKQSLKDFDSINQEKYDLETRLKDLMENNVSLDSKLNSNLDEINAYQLTIEDNKTDLINSAETINKLQKQLEERESDIQELHINISDLNSVISELQSKNTDYENMEFELSDLKSTLTEYEAEISQNNEVIGQLNGKLVSLNRRIMELENLLATKEEIIKNLEEKDQKFKFAIDDMKGKYLQLQEQLNVNNKEIGELTNRNKEQLEKMKKLAANLKKKTQAYQELETQYKNLQEKKLHESLQQEMSAIDSNITVNRNVAEDKIRELELLLETNENTLIHYKERTEKLENDLQDLEKEKFNLEALNKDLHEKLVINKNSLKEKNLLENQLEAKLVEINEMTKAIQTSETEREDLAKKNQENEEIIKKLKVKLKKSHERVNELKALENNFQDVEAINQQLKSQIALLEDHQRHIQHENESLQKQNLSDYEKIESDYQAQLEELLKAKSELQTDNEKFTEKIKEFQEREQEFTMEFEELNGKIEELNSKYEVVFNENCKLKAKIEEFDNEDRKSKAKINELFAKIDESSNEVNELKAKVHEFSNENSILKTKIDEFVSENSELGTKCKEFADENSELKAKISEFSNENAELKAKIEEFENSDRKLKAKINEIMTKIAEFKNVNAELRANFQEFANENSELKAKIDEFVNEKSEFMCKIDNEKIEELRQRIKEFENANNELTSKIREFANENSELRAKIQQFANENCELRAKIDQFDNQQIEQLRIKINEFANENSELKAEIQEIYNLRNEQAKEEELRAQINEFRRENYELKTKIEQLHNEKIELNNNLQKSTEKIQDLLQENQKFQQEIQALEFVKSTLEASYDASTKPNELSQQFLPEINSGQNLSLILQEEQNEISQEEVNSLKNELEHLKEEIQALQFAKSSLEASYEASQKPATEESQILQDFQSKNESAVPLFSAFAQPSHNSTIFDDIGAHSSQSVIENGREDLLKKIKALEFLLYNIDKEKEIALDQCTEMLNALIELLTQKEDANIQPINKDYDFESQIMSQKDIEGSSNKSQLQKLEFQQSAPMEAVEPLVEAKKAYLCFTKEDKPQSFEAFEENDDGWCWGPEESRLEEEHHENTVKLKETIKILQLERENHLEEIKQLQIKAGKLIKKYKELKGSQNKQTDDFDLNETIQEELKNQIRQLEKRLKELDKENEKEKAEKQNLLKKVDVLTSANEKMVEMKDIQDSEILRLTRKYEEIKEKLKENEWGFVSDENPESKDKIKELQDNIRELTLDNEELQALLEEQTAKKLEAEKNTRKICEEENLLKELKENLENQIAINEELKKELEELKTSKPSSMETFNWNDPDGNQENIFDNFGQKTANSKQQEQELIINDLENNLEQLMKRKTELDQQIVQIRGESELKIGQLMHEIQEIKNEKIFLQEAFNKAKTDLEAKIHEVEELEKLKLNEQNFEKTIKELNDNWQMQVDQRGADVAESWRMHLEMVEKDFNENQEKLKTDLLAYEERLKILTNENLQLKTNAGQEVENEISALQQQITNLSQNLMEKQKEIEKLQSETAEKDNKLSSINVIIETTQKQFDEKREVVEEIISILEKQTSQRISYEKNDILMEFNRQLTETYKLNQELTRITGEKQREITGLNQIIEDLEKDLSVVHEKEAEIVRLTNQLDKSNQEKLNLQTELNKLMQEHSNCLITIEDARKKVEEYYNSQLSLQSSLEEKNQEIQELNRQILDLSMRNDRNKEVESLNSTMEGMKKDYLDLQASFSECQNQLYETTQQLAEKIQQIQTKSDYITQYEQNIAYYDQENNNLKNLLEQREKEYHQSLEMLKNNQLADLQRHYDELISNRDIDINTLRGQVQELMNANQSYGEKLNEEIVLKQQLEVQLGEQTRLVNEDTKQLEELKTIIEEQAEMLSQLRKELFEKSNQYDSLIAEIDIGRAPVTQQPSNKKPKQEEDLSEPVSRAELDLALYMLHQRDVRCEELTVELTQLLEERDTLQLRLSNAIREKEEIRRGIEPQTVSETIQTASGKDLLENEENLASKLSELKNVGYKKDKTFVDEQEARRMQQFAIMQQHINEASKLPAEAAAKLVDASYTLSRDVQSPSKVLLNWLWGKNPPKANDS